LHNLVEKTIDTPQQAGLAREARLKNQKNSFDFNTKYSIQNLDGKNILIIDDVYSTGATMNECAKVIKRKYKNANIYGLSIARGV